MIYLVIALLLFRWLAPKRPKHVLNVYFGVPGSGKTTFAAYLAKRSMTESRVITWAKNHPNRFSRWLLGTKLLKRSEPVWSNVPITGTYALDPRLDIGNHMIAGGKVIIDEAGIEYNNRKDKKEFPREAIYWYKYHRHYQCSVDVFSQSHEDMDVTLRRLAQNYFVVKKSLLPWFIVCKRIRRKVGIDETTHQIVDHYYFGLPILDTKWVFSPPLWKLFNSFSRKELPEKDWPIW